MITIGLTTFTNHCGKRETITRELLERLGLFYAVGQVMDARGKILRFVLAKDAYFRALGAPVSYATSADLKEIMWEWNDDACKEVWRELLNRVRYNSRRNSDVCPWCLLNTHCKTCAYGVRRGICDEFFNTPYMQLITYFGEGMLLRGTGLNLPLMRDYIVLLEMITVGEEEE